MTAHDISNDLSIRSARGSDRAALERLAQLDTASRLEGPALIAEQGGRAVAAIALGDGRCVADPWVPTAAIVEMLRERARQLAVAPPPRRLRLRPLRRRVIPIRSKPA